MAAADLDRVHAIIRDALPACCPGCGTPAPASDIAAAVVLDLIAAGVLTADTAQEG